MTYAEKLKDPRWQKKRLRILERDGFKCLYCSDTDKTLHVHHGYYESGKDPWDYEDDTLHTLCEDCHVSIEEIKRDIHLEIGRVHPVMLHVIMKYIQKYKEDEQAAIKEWANRINEALNEKT